MFDWVCFDLLACHHSYEFLVINLSVAIDISLPDHFINFFICEFLTQVGHNVAYHKNS